jgi:DNA-directed RNA polymerase omega subunit
MINKPPIGELQKKVDCRYMLVSVVAKRARQLVGHDEMLRDRKAVSVATDELNSGRLRVSAADENAK